jgi:signal transduction histidine kinase
VKLVLDAKRAADIASLQENHLRQVLYNLVQNAIEASPEGGVVRITAAIDQPGLTISVIDQGHGIPEEVRPLRRIKMSKLVKFF